jgi:AraC-like DNA-binding protein
MDDPRTWVHFWPSAPSIREHLIECIGVGEEFDKRGGPRNRVLPSHQVIFVSRGTGVVCDPSSGAEWRVEGPAVAWQTPGVPHTYSPTRAGWDEHWILFAGAGATIARELRGRTTVAPVSALHHWPERITELFGRLRDLRYASGKLPAFRASILVQQILLEANLASVDAVADLDLLDRFTAGWRDRASIEQHARRLGVSLRTLRRAVATETGRTPIELLTEIRLSRACASLLETNRDIGTIAREVGFDDPAYFSRRFSQRFGVPPVTFRTRRGMVDRGEPDS